MSAHLRAAWRTVAEADPFDLCGATVTRDRGYQTPVHLRMERDRCGKPGAVEVRDEDGRWYMTRCQRHRSQAESFIEGMDGMEVVTL